ncbi:MAG: nickel pincer cofactor biosynthesis protein LarC [Pyrinomonadaceae bacterium]
MKTLYFDCFAGASGNMILGALIAAGVVEAELKRELAKLDIPKFEFEIETVDRAGISSLHLNVKVPDEKTHRHLSDIVSIIENSSLTEKVKTWSIAIFRKLAEAEAKVHGIGIEKVHFHEVGGLDAVIDIVGSCIGFEMLGIEHFVCSKIHIGSGFVQMAHGKFPVPPPAVAELLRGIPIYSTKIEGELITPTGAAIISTLCYSYGVLSEIVIEQISYGAGTRTYQDFPNVLRLLTGESNSTFESIYKNGKVERLFLLEANLDDLSPQILGFVMERALEIGANDCWFTPIQMKKNRPAVLLSILCPQDIKGALLELIYSETTTLGIREQLIVRTELDREVESVNTKFGPIDVKVGLLNGHVVNAMPEYEQVRAAAITHRVPFSEVRDEALSQIGRTKAVAN